MRFTTRRNATHLTPLSLKRIRGKNIRINKLIFFPIIVIIAILILCAKSISPNVPENKVGRTYECDYYSLSLNTHITFEEDGEEYSISGKIFTFLTDPLKLRSSNGDTVGYADDSYNLITQDDHSIVVDGKFEIAVKGEFEFVGEEYTLLNEKGEIVGRAEFNGWCTSGAIYNNNNEAIAVYSRTPLMNDYSVTIYDNDLCSDKAILMIIASYVSDYHADTSNN